MPRCPGQPIRQHTFRHAAGKGDIDQPGGNAAVIKRGHHEPRGFSQADLREEVADNVEPRRAALPEKLMQPAWLWQRRRAIGRPAEERASCPRQRPAKDVPGCKRLQNTGLSGETGTDGHEGAAAAPSAGSSPIVPARHATGCSLSPWRRAPRNKGSVRGGAARFNPRSHRRLMWEGGCNAARLPWVPPATAGGAARRLFDIGAFLRRAQAERSGRSPVAPAAAPAGRQADQRGPKRTRRRSGEDPRAAPPAIAIGVGRAAPSKMMHVQAPAGKAAMACLRAPQPAAVRPEICRQYGRARPFARPRSRRHAGCTPALEGRGRVCETPIPASALAR